MTKISMAVTIILSGGRQVVMQPIKTNNNSNNIKGIKLMVKEIKCVAEGASKNETERKERKRKEWERNESKVSEEGKESKREGMKRKEAKRN